MKPIAAFGMAVVLASVLAAPGFAAGGSEPARDANARNQVETPSQTTTPWSSTVSSPNTLSHDGNSQLGTNQPERQRRGNNQESSNVRDQAAKPGQTTTPSVSNLSSVDTPKWNKLERPQNSDPAATSAGCAGTC